MYLYKCSINRLFLVCNTFFCVLDSRHMIHTQVRKLLLFGSTLLASLLLFTSFVLPVSAQEYDCGTYGGGVYDNNEQCVPAGSAGDDGSDSGGGLSNTGQALAIVIPAALIASGGIMLYRLNRKSDTKQSDTDT